MPRIYLAGPINGCDDRQAKGWRELVKSADYGDRTVRFSDPMDRDYRGREDTHGDQIVAQDMSAIADSDILLANCWKPSYGTAMEIMYAFDNVYEVIIIVPENEPVSPWLRFHADTIVHSVDEAIEKIRSSH